MINLLESAPEKQVFQEDINTDFAANDRISTLDYVTKQDRLAGYIFKRYDDHIVLCRQILNELHIPKVSECIRNDHELSKKLFFT